MLMIYQMNLLADLLCRASTQGLHPHLPRSVLSAPTRPALIEVLVDGTIPPESSLSSSAAMTTCSSIVVLEAFGARELIPRTEMAEVAIESERLVGVNSGGMDQSASIFSIPHHALYISFHPKLTIQPIRLPPSSPEHTFVIANTLIVSDKKVTGPVNYNLRVVETRMAARALAKRLGLPLDASTVTLKGVLETYFQQNALDESEQRVKDAKSKFGEEAARLEFMAAQVDAVFKKEPLDRNEVEQLTGYNGKAFEEEFLSAFPSTSSLLQLSVCASPAADFLHPTSSSTRTLPRNHSPRRHLQTPPARNPRILRSPTRARFPLPLHLRLLHLFYHQLFFLHCLGQRRVDLRGPRRAHGREPKESSGAVRVQLSRTGRVDRYREIEWGVG